MKYKYTRKEFLKKVGFLFSKGKILVPNEVDGEELMKLLLAQKEDRKECKHIPDREVGLNVWSCKKCRCCFVHKSTPSPLELPKINNNFSSMEQYNWAKQITDEVNKLYQLIKEKL